VQEVGDDIPDPGDQVGPDFGVAELVLGLRLENGILEADRDGADHGFAHVVAVKLGLGEFVDALEEALPERREVRAAVGGELPVDERKEGFVEPLGMGEGDFQGGGAMVERPVDGFIAHFLEDQVGEAVFRNDFLAVVNEGEAGVQAGVEPQAALDQVVLVRHDPENAGIGLEFDQRAVGFAGTLAGKFLDDFPARKPRTREFSFAVRLDKKGGGEGIDGLGADAVEADGKLENIVVVLRTRIDARDALDHLAERNAPAIVAYVDLGACDRDVDALPVAHDELVHRVVDDLLQQDIDAVVVLGAIAHPPDVHARPLANVLQRGQRLDLAFVVVVDGLGHGGKTTGP